MLAPHLLRRVKEDVEKSIPRKEETIIEVELTLVQKQYYRAILERNRLFLYRGCDKSNLPGLSNIEMQLRKCCNHPYLINGVEEKDVVEFETTLRQQVKARRADLEELKRKRREARAAREAQAGGAGASSSSAAAGGGGEEEEANEASGVGASAEDADLERLQLLRRLPSHHRRIERMVEASGKLVLLDKLLPKL